MSIFERNDIRRRIKPELMGYVYKRHMERLQNLIVEKKTKETYRYDTLDDLFVQNVQKLIQQDGCFILLPDGYKITSWLYINPGITLFIQTPDIILLTHKLERLKTGIIELTQEEIEYDRRIESYKPCCFPV
jgi:hypothetical protein